MQGKLIAGAAVLAVGCFVGGAMFSNQVLGSEAEEAHAAEIAALTQQVDDGTNVAGGLRDDLANAKRRSSARISDLERQLDQLRTDVKERDTEIARLAAELSAARPAGTAAEDGELSRSERWKQIQSTLSPVMAILNKMGQKGANQFELGPLMVAELGKLAPSDFDELMAFDEAETDPAIIAEIRAVMLQALIFVPGVSDKRNDYMDRYLERANRGGYGENFTAGALRRVTFSMPPFVDGYARIIQPLDAELREKFLETAVDRAARGTNEQLRLDGVAYLEHSESPRATTELTQVFTQSTNSMRLRRAALKGLSKKADADVLRVLQESAEKEQDAELRAAAAAAAANVEKLLANKR